MDKTQNPGHQFVLHAPFGEVLTAAQARAYGAACAAAALEAAAKVCEGYGEAASHSSDGLKRVGATSMAAACAKAVRSLKPKE